eukprot:6275159-Pyramimonas_sp.AAC.1
MAAISSWAWPASSMISRATGAACLKASADGVPLEIHVEQSLGRAGDRGGGVPNGTAAVQKDVVDLVGSVMPCAVAVAHA